MRRAALGLAAPPHVTPVPLVTVVALVTLVGLALATPARAHVGSPHVYTERTVAGLDLFAVVHLPPAVPGEAEVQVRLQDHDPAVPVSLRVREIPPVGDDYAPPAADMRRDSADPSFYTAPMSLMDYGLWQAEIQIDGPEGSESFRVDVPARVGRTPAMEAGRATILAALSVLIFLSLWRILSGIARAGHLATDAAPTARDVRRGRLVALAGCVIFAALFAGIGYAWSSFDAALRAASRDPVTAELRALGPPAVAGSSRAFELVLSIDGRPMQGVGTADDGSLRALLVRQDDLSWLRTFRARPIRPGVYGFELDFGEPGTHGLFIDYARKDGEATVVRELEVLPGAEGSSRTAGSSQAFEAPPVGELLGERAWPIDDGASLRWVAPDEAPAVGELVRLELALESGADEGSTAIDRSEGSRTQLIVMREDGGVYVRLTPTRSADDPSHVAFPYGFPTAGLYRLFVQLRAGDELHRGAFDIEVR